MHEVIGGGVSPRTALAVGFKVDMDTLPQAVRDAIAAGQVDLDDPATTVTLLKLGAVVGVVGQVDAAYDARFNHDGKSMPTVIPPAFGLRNVAREVYTGDDTVSYWNLYVGITQMHGHGSFADARIGVNISNPPENLTAAKLSALRAYQFSLDKPVASAFDAAAAARGKIVFDGAGQCASCHVGAEYTDVNAGILHTPAEAGQDGAYAARSATGKYRTTPLRGLYHPPQLQGPYFHDGSAATLGDVVDHYAGLRSLTLTAQQEADLVEYLKSL